MKIILRPLEKQRRIVALLKQASRIIRICQEIMEQSDTLVKSRFVEMFGDPVTNSHSLPNKLLGDVCFLKAGITTSPSKIKEQIDEEHTVPCYGGNGIRGYVREATYKGDYPIIGRQGALCGNVQFANGEFHATEHAVLVTPKIPFNPVCYM